MPDFNIRIAGINCRISSLHKDVFIRCRDYLVPDDVAVDIEAAMTQDAIDVEREKSRRIHQDDGSEPYIFSDGYLESLAVYRRIAEQMPAHRAFLIHGSAVSVDGLAYIFIAPSGTGKSTHVRFWRELFGDRAVMVNDDKPFIRVEKDGKAFICGTPWDGKHRLSSNIEVPLAAICTLQRGEENTIEKIDFDEALPNLIKQIYRPYDNEAMAQTVCLIDEMKVDHYVLNCTPDPEAAKVAYEAMSGKTV